MKYISDRLRSLVFVRAKGRCEYCGLAQEGQAATFHVDHIHPRSEGGPTDASNLAFACVTCSLRKGDREQGIDPQTDTMARLFHSRLDAWTLHFEWRVVGVVGKTSVGRATVAALNLNHIRLRRIRKEEVYAGRHPPR